MTIYLIGCAIAWIFLFTLVVIVMINDEKDEKTPLNVLDITVVSLFSWLLVFGLIIALILIASKSKDKE